MITITYYEELAKFVAGFGDGHFNMLVICSRGGLGKSEEVRRTLDIATIQQSVRTHSDINKLRFLLYPSGLMEEDEARIRKGDAGVVWLGKK